MTARPVDGELRVVRPTSIESARLVEATEYDEARPGQRVARRIEVAARTGLGIVVASARRLADWGPDLSSPIWTNRWSVDLELVAGGAIYRQSCERFAPTAKSLVSLSGRFAERVAELLAGLGARGDGVRACTSPRRTKRSGAPSPPRG